MAIDTNTLIGVEVAIAMSELGVFAIAWFSYRMERKRDKVDRERAREKMIAEQTGMHMENKFKLEAVIKFIDNQDIINTKRDIQIIELTSQTQQLATQTALLTQLVATSEKRLLRIEDKL